MPVALPHMYMPAQRLLQPASMLLLHQPRQGRLGIRICCMGQLMQVVLLQGVGRRWWGGWLVVGLVMWGQGQWAVVAQGYGDQAVAAQGYGD